MELSKLEKFAYIVLSMGHLYHSVYIVVAREDFCIIFLPDQFHRDPNQIVNIPFYIGALSNLGMFFGQRLPHCFQLCSASQNGIGPNLLFGYLY